MNDEKKLKKTAAEHHEVTELIVSFVGGDRDSFDKLVLMYKDQVFNLCYRLLGDYQEANDCAQDVFVKVLRSLKGFRFSSKFSTWLYKIAVNTCKNRMKSAEYRHHQSTFSLSRHDKNGSWRGARDIPDSSLSPAEKIEKSELQALIQKAIDELPPESKMVVVLRDIEGFAYEDIARITGYNLGTVKSKLSRARKMLKNKLKEVI